MDNAHLKINALKQTIARQESEVANLEREIARLEADLAPTRTRYQRLIAPLLDKVEAARSAVEELERERWRENYNRGLPLQNADALPSGWVSVEDQYRSVWEAPSTPSYVQRRDELPRIFPIVEDEQPPEETPEQRLKRLYRKLARLYHPDLAGSQTDRLNRNDIMALINRAYTEKDVDALAALDKRPDSADPETPLYILQLRQLEQQSIELDERIIDLRAELNTLTRSEMMRLHVEARTAKLRGRDLLQEMADGLQREYDAHMRRLQELRRR